MNLDGYRCWLIIVAVMTASAAAAAGPAHAAATATAATEAPPPGRRRVVYCDVEGAPRGAALFPALGPPDLPAACDALLFRTMGLIGDRVWCAIALLPRPRAAGLFTGDGLVAGWRLGALQAEILGPLRDGGRYPDDRSVFGALAARQGRPLPAILYLEPVAAAPDAPDAPPTTAAAAAGRTGGAMEVAVSDLIAADHDAVFPFGGAGLGGRRPPSADAEGREVVELPLLIFYLLNEIAIYHWCRYCIDLLGASDLAPLEAGEPGSTAAAPASTPPEPPGGGGGTEAAYRAFFAAIRGFRAHLSALRHELPRLRAEVASCRRFFARFAAPPPPVAGQGPPGGGGGRRGLTAFNVEVVDDLLQRMATLIDQLAEQAATLHEDARQNFHAVALAERNRLDRRHLLLTYALLALVLVLVLDSPGVRWGLAAGLSAVRGAAAAAVFDPLLDRLLAGLLPPDG